MRHYAPELERTGSRTQELTAEVIWSKLNILKTTSGILVDDFGSKPVNGNV